MAFQLQISAKILNWPRSCACCCGPADREVPAAASRTTGKRVQHTKTYWWNVPYCSRCTDHARLYAQAPMWLTVGLILATVTGILFLASDHPVIGVLVFAALLSGGVWAYLQALKNASAYLAPGCSTRRIAVKYVEWYGTSHTFIFANRAYLQSFIDANSRKTMSDVREV
jgi:hypothetical protein